MLRRTTEGKLKKGIYVQSDSSDTESIKKSEDSRWVFQRPEVVENKVSKYNITFEKLPF